MKVTPAMLRNSSTARCDPAFYSQIFAHLNAPKTVLDLACGLHPIAFAHYAPAAPSVTYYAADIYTDLAAFLNTAFPLLEIQGRAFTADLLAEEVSTTLLEEVGEVDVVLLFKILPLLDLWDKSASARLLDGLPTKQIVVTYPTQSLGGNRCGMSRNYTQRFTELTANTGWQITPLEFPKEIGFVITK